MIFLHAHFFLWRFAHFKGQGVLGSFHLLNKYNQSLGDFLKFHLFHLLQHISKIKTYISSSVQVINKSILFLMLFWSLNLIWIGGGGRPVGRGRNRPPYSFLHFTQKIFRRPIPGISWLFLTFGCGYPYEIFFFEKFCVQSMTELLRHPVQNIFIFFP